MKSNTNKYKLDTLIRDLQRHEEELDELDDEEDFIRHLSYDTIGCE